MKRLLRSGSGREVVGAVTWNFTGMLFSLITGVLTARILDPSDRGLLALALTISSLSYLVSSVGTNSAVRTYQPRERWASFRSYFRISVYLVLLNSVVVIGVVLLFTNLGFTKFSEHVLVIAILGILTFTSNQLLDMFNASGRASQSAMANTCGHFATTVSLLILFSILPAWANLQAVLACYAFSFMCRVITMLILARREKFNLGETDAPSRKQFLRSSTKFWGINLGQTLTFRSDQLLLALLSNAYNVGIYAVAAAPAALMQVVSNSIGQVAHREAAIGRMTVSRLFRFIVGGLGISMTYALLLWVLAPWAIPLIYGPDYQESVAVVRVLLIASLFRTPYSILVRVLAGLNHPHFASLSGLVGLVALVLALVILVPSYGAVGAAFGAVASYASMLCVTIVGCIASYKRAAA